MRHQWRLLSTLLIAASLLFVPITARAATLTTLSFDNITGNNAIDAAIGEAQLFVDVLDDGCPAQIQFKFRNTGPAASSITDIYFDDDELSPVLASLFVGADSGAGVEFEAGASPGNLPGGNDPDVDFSATASADSTSPAQPNGVNPGEFVIIGFSLAAGVDCADVIDALESGSLRVGIHVQGFAGGGSESFVNVPPPPPPPVDADVSIVKSGPGVAQPGDNIVYTFVVTNNDATDTAENVVVTDTLPAGLTYVSGTVTQGLCSIVLSTLQLTCELGSLGPGATATITVTVTVQPDIAPEFCNTATVTSTTPDPNPGNNSSTSCSEVPPPPDNTPPACKLVRVAAGPPAQLFVEVQDTGSGIKTIQVTKLNNATIQFNPGATSGAFPTFNFDGTTGLIQVVATKINQSKSAQVELKVTDEAGNITYCDPIIVDAGRENGKPVTNTFTGEHGVSEMDTWLKIIPNTDVNSVEVVINGTRLRFSGLRAGEEHHMDIAHLMNSDAEGNTVSITLYGKPDTKAVVMLGYDG